MKFKYFPLGVNYLKNIENKKDVLVVFSDYFLENTFLKLRDKNILVPSGTFLTFDEFQKEIFVTDRIVLTEAKRPLTLYQNISQEVKDFFDIKNYYDIIDIADLFFTYYRDLNLNLISKIDTTLFTEWQKDRIEKFDKMKEEYDKFLEKNNFIPSDWIVDEKNFNTEFIEKFNKIIFIDNLCFTPLLKKVLKELDKNIEIEFILQGNSDIYNENELTLNKIDMGEKYFQLDSSKVKVYETNEDIETVFNLLYILSEEKKLKNIYTPRLNDEYFSKIMPKYFINGKLKIMEDTWFYKFMNLQNDLIKSIEERKELGLKIENFLEFIENLLTQKIYSISKEIKKIFYKIMEEEYRYISPKVFEDLWIKDLIKDNEEIIDIFKNLYEDLLRIKNFKSTDEFYNYFKEIGFEKIADREYIDFLEKFHEVIFNVKSSEKLLGKKGFQEIFKKDCGQYIYTLIIKYLEGIELKSIEKEKNDKFVGFLKKIEEAKINFGEKSYYVDITNGNLPGNIEKNQMFTDKQLEELGFETRETEINLMKYRFLQYLGNSKENIIFYKKEKDGKIGKSVFLEELMIEKNIKVEDKILNTTTGLKMIEEYLYKERNFLLDDREFQMKKDIENLCNKDGIIEVGTYDILKINECQYKFLLDKIYGLDETKENSYGGSLRVLGIIVHSILEKVTEKVYYEIITKNNFEVDEELVTNILRNEIRKNNMKIPTYLDIYFERVMAPHIKQGVIKFYKKIEDKLKGEKVKSFFGEKDKRYFSEYNKDDKTKPNIMIRGRMDLIVATEDKSLIIDYKTGSKADGQLDIYSIMNGNEDIKGYIYNVLKKELEEVEQKITEKDLDDIFKKFVEDENYSKKEKSCNGCIYENICRKEVR